jgi:hypothetical protein
MKSFFKLSVAAVLFGAMGFMAAVPASAGEVAKGDNGTLNIGVYVFSRMGMFTPGGSVGESKDGPSALTAYGEGIVNTAATNKDGDLTGIVEMRVRSAGGAQGQETGTPTNVYFTGAELAWRPVENLRIDVGLLPGRDWQERVTQSDQYTGFRPVAQGNDYLWFPEAKRGADITYTIPGDMKIDVGLWLPTDSPNWNSGQPRDDATMWANGGVDNPNTPQDDSGGLAVVTSAYVPHVQITAADWMFSALYGSETLEGSGDGWATTDKSTNSGGAIVFRYNYMENSFAKVGYVMTAFDKFNAYNQAAEETHTTIAAAAQQGIGGPYSVYLEYSTTTDEQGQKGNERQWTVVGFKKNVAGGRVQVFYESDDVKTDAADPDASTFIGVGGALFY